MTNQQALSDPERLILTTTARYQKTIAQVTPQSWWGAHEREEWAVDVEHGPLWSPTRWFLASTNSEIVEWRRTLSRLEKRGLVEVYRREDRKASHVRLTDAGAKLVRGLG